ncbi:MAG: caspase family protein [Xanthobacteraceae bacterium]
MISRLVRVAAVGGAFWLGLGVTAALADKRVALVIGNSGYQNVARLPNPASDAKSIAKLLVDAGFDSVDLQQDVGNLDFKRALRRFEDNSRDADIAVVFYAGHGLELGGINYMIPVDAKLASDRDAQDEAISLDRITDSVDSARRLRLVILDACRDNPFVVSMKRVRQVSRSLSSGLGKVEPPGTDTLIAYAAKAGSTADDGIGEHSPFTTALMNSLTVPGLDVRLAFGRVRDEVLKITNQRQEPFVYGSLGGGNISLVPPPARPQETSVSDVKADYELVAQVGTRRAWEVFINTYKTGFYTDLARAQLAKLGPELVAPASPPPAANTTVAALQPPSPPSQPQPSSAEQRAWEALAGSTDPAALQAFIRRYPNSPYAVAAQQRVDVLKRAAQERDDAARAQALAAQQKADEDRKAKAAEAERVRLEQLAAQQKAQDEQRAKAAEADRLKQEALAAQKRADEAARAQAAEVAAQKKAELQAAQQVAEEERRTKAAEADKLKQEALAVQQRADAERRAQAAEAERQRLQALADAQQRACIDEQVNVDALRTGTDPAAALSDARQLQKNMVCDNLRPQVAALIPQLSASAARAAAAAAQAAAAQRDRITNAQKQLARLGCYPGAVNGQMNDATQTAVSRYLTQKGRDTAPTDVTDDLVTELSKQSSRVCPLECPEGQAASGSICIANAPAAPPPSSPTAKADDSDTSQKAQKGKRDNTASKPAQKPAARQQASSAPRVGGTTIGVGF